MSCILKKRPASQSSAVNTELLHDIKPCLCEVAIEHYTL